MAETKERTGENTLRELEVILGEWLFGEGDLDALLREHVEAVANAAAETARLAAERDRETQLRRAAEAHNAELRAALNEKPYRDEYEALEAELAAARERADTLEKAIDRAHAQLLLEQQTPRVREARLALAPAAHEYLKRKHAAAPAPAGERSEG